MSMSYYGLREARTLIAAERKLIAADYPRSTDPYVRGMRDALKSLDNRIGMKLDEYKNAPLTRAVS